mmetsp:Transcript_8194/g.28312  ORF Transcript_8194/g.28312 Transcript_8194/m.28312 type:complete len:457 (-) Transcript_8194:1597-2967(-)
MRRRPSRRRSGVLPRRQVAVHVDDERRRGGERGDARRSFARARGRRQGRMGAGRALPGRRRPRGGGAPLGLGGDAGQRASGAGGARAEGVVGCVDALDLSNFEDGGFCAPQHFEDPPTYQTIPRPPERRHLLGRLGGERLEGRRGGGYSASPRDVASARESPNPGIAIRALRRLVGRLGPRESDSPGRGAQAQKRPCRLARGEGFRSLARVDGVVDRARARRRRRRLCRFGGDAQRRPENDGPPAAPRVARAARVHGVCLCEDGGNVGVERRSVQPCPDSKTPSRFRRPACPPRHRRFGQDGRREHLGQRGARQRLSCCSGNEARACSQGLSPTTCAPRRRARRWMPAVLACGGRSFGRGAAAVGIVRGSRDVVRGSRDDRGEGGCVPCSRRHGADLDLASASLGRGALRARGSAGEDGLRAAGHGGAARRFILGCAVAGARSGRRVRGGFADGPV